MSTGSKQIALPEPLLVSSYLISPGAYDLYAVEPGPDRLYSELMRKEKQLNGLDRSRGLSLLPFREVEKFKNRIFRLAQPSESA
jgi:hypothetical protein